MKPEYPIVSPASRAVSGKVGGRAGLHNLAGEAAIVIYAALSPSGRYYIGQTDDFARRKREHYNCARKRIGGCRAFEAALRKHGDKMEWSIIGLAFGRDAANEAEIALIAEYNALAPHGYNLRTGGDGGAHCEETRARMSASKQGRELPADHRAAISAGLRRVRPRRPRPPALRPRGRPRNPDKKGANPTHGLTGQKQSPAHIERRMRAVFGAGWKKKNCAAP